MISTDHGQYIYGSAPQFRIRWEDVPISNTLGDEFKEDIVRITAIREEDTLWIRQNGDSILMREMHDEHIVNALHMCKRDLFIPIQESGRYQYLLLEAIHRGLMKRDIGEWDSEENT